MDESEFDALGDVGSHNAVEIPLKDTPEEVSFDRARAFARFEFPPTVCR